MLNRSLPLQLLHITASPLKEILDPLLLPIYEISWILRVFTADCMELFSITENKLFKSAGQEVNVEV